MVRTRGLEPARVAPLEPKSSASANSATFAYLESITYEGRKLPELRVCPFVALSCRSSTLSRYRSSFAAASCKLRSSTTLYRSNTLRVFHPPMAMTTRSGTPALTKFRAACTSGLTLGERSFAFCFFEHSPDAGIRGKSRMR